jgi:hypothetical protein
VDHQGVDDGLQLSVLADAYGARYAAWLALARHAPTPHHAAPRRHRSARINRLTRLLLPYCTAPAMSLKRAPAPVPAVAVWSPITLAACWRDHDNEDHGATVGTTSAPADQPQAASLEHDVNGLPDETRASEAASGPLAAPESSESKVSHACCDPRRTII